MQVGDELDDDLVGLLAALVLITDANLKMQELNYPQHSEHKNDLGVFRMMLKHYVELDDKSNAWSYGPNLPPVFRRWV